ncbi:MAG: flagellar biosynthesis protein FlhB [Gemmatimonadales bacterium]|nr:flagellar biosynthesis protein FlhB [Gemmatimonadales bacterium]
MAEEGGGEKTEKATGKRREEARKKGQVAKSQEVSGAAILLVGMAVLVASSGHFSRVLGDNTSYLFSQAHILKPENLFGVQELLTCNLENLVVALGPILLAVLIAAFGSNVMQIGFHASAEALSFKGEKLNPISGMKKFFRKNAFFDLLKNIMKISVISLLGWAVITGMMDKLIATPVIPVADIVAVGKSGFLKLMAILVAFTFVVAIVDWFWQKHQYEENLKMSKHEIKQEFKDIEGDPQIKARIRGLQFEMARKRMLADVPTADVVITNPTHFAVALKYVSGQPAPIVVAKGQDNIAQMIKKIARKARVPVMENKPLARGLYKEVEIGKMVPESFYQAVAEVLAYVYRLNKA